MIYTQCTPRFRLNAETHVVYAWIYAYVILPYREMLLSSRESAYPITERSRNHSAKMSQTPH